MLHKYLEHFKAVAQTGSLTIAANLLNISQPSLSRSIKLLEEDIGFLLFHRKNRRVILTKYGRSLYHHTCFMEQEFDNALVDLNYIKTKELKSFKIGCGIVWQYCIIPRIMAAYQIKHPDIRLEITSAHSETLYENFLSGNFDLILCDLEGFSPVEGIVIDRIIQPRFTLFARKGHPLFSISGDIIEEEILLYNIATFIHSSVEYISPIDDYKMLSNLHRNQIKFMTTSVGNLIETVAATDFITSIPLELYEQAEKFGLREISPAFRRSSFHSGAIFRKISERKNVLTDFLVLIKEQVKIGSDLFNGI